MVIDVHCHVGYSARRADPSIPRFSFEADGAQGMPGYDSYLSPRVMAKPAWWCIRRMLGIDPSLQSGDGLDAVIEERNERHWSNATGVDRLVLLAFDEYHNDEGCVLGPARVGQRRGSDLYVSNSLVWNMCRRRPDRYLFGASIHPYRVQDGRDASELLEELVASAASASLSPKPRAAPPLAGGERGGRPVLVKWLPIHQNICAEDPRTVAFLRTAARLNVAMLIHYGGEMSLGRQHMEFERPEPMLEVLRWLRREDEMPTVIVAHAATPSFPFQNTAGFRALIDAMLQEFSDAPLYADISALAAFGRTRWLRYLADRPETHRKLLWATDYPIPVMRWPFRLRLEADVRRRLAKLPSWIQQDLELKRALGFSECVFTQAAEVLGLNS